MAKTYVLDTNVLIQAPYALYCFEDNKVVIPLVVLEELSYEEAAARLGVATGTRYFAFTLPGAKDGSQRKGGDPQSGEIKKTGGSAERRDAGQRRQRAGGSKLCGCAASGTSARG